MNDDNRKLLENEIKSELELLIEMETGSDERKATVDELSKLIDRSINLKKLDIENQEKLKEIDVNKRLKLKQMRIDKELKERQLKLEEEAQKFKEEQTKIENELKMKEIKQNKIDKTVGHTLTMIGIAVPSILTIWGTIKSLKFEETGTVTTIMGRGFIQKLLPRK